MVLAADLARSYVIWDGRDFRPLEYNSRDELWAPENRIRDVLYDGKDCSFEVIQADLWVLLNWSNLMLNLWHRRTNQPTNGSN